MAFQVEASLLSVRIVLEGWPLVRGWSYHFCPKGKIGLKSIFWEMGNFWSMCLEASIKVIFEYHDLGILFCSLKRFGRFKAVASLDAYQITNYQFLQKFIFSFAWFSKNLREFANQESYGQCLRRCDQMVYWIFSKSCLSVHQGFQKIPKWESVY